MNHHDLNEIKKNLLALREELLADVVAGDEATKAVELDQSRVGRLSRMDAMQGQAMSRELKRRRELELQKIASALIRIDDGDYGFCLACGEEISNGRLEFDPAAPLCLGCASSRE